MSLRNRRISAGLSRANAAVLIGVTEEQLARYERGLDTISPLQKRRMHEYYGPPPEVPKPAEIQSKPQRQMKAKEKKPIPEPFTEKMQQEQVTGVNLDQFLQRVS